MERKLLGILCVLSILTFTTSLFSTLLIYFNDSNHTKVNSNSILNKNTRYKKSMIVYENGKHIEIRNVASEFEKDYSFKIVNDNSDEIVYNIKWGNVVSDWNSSDYQNFFYSVSCDNGITIDKQNMPFSNEEKSIVSSLLLNSNKVVSCSIKIQYSGNYIEQTNNSFTADVGVFVNS